MARYAQVHSASGFVTNVFMWDPEAQPGLTPPPGYTFVPDTDPPAASPGGTYDGSTFLPSPEPTPPPEAA